MPRRTPSIVGLLSMGPNTVSVRLWLTRFVVCLLLLNRLVVFVMRFSGIQVVTFIVGYSETLISLVRTLLRSAALALSVKIFRLSVVVS